RSMLIHSSIHARLSSTLFPYTTLFRSLRIRVIFESGCGHRLCVGVLQITEEDREILIEHLAQFNTQLGSSLFTHGTPALLRARGWPLSCGRRANLGYFTKQLQTCGNGKIICRYRSDRAHPVPRCRRVSVGQAPTPHT